MALTRYKILHKSGGKTTVNSGSSTNVSVNTSSGTEYFNRYFYWDAEHESVHCRYSLVGDYEVSAFGYGSSSGSGGGGGGGDVDLSDYVTYEFLSSQSYVTNNTLNTTLNSYVTEQELSDKGYVTNSALSRMGYITKSDVSNMGYLTQSDVSNMGYITQDDMDATLSGYVKMSYLNQQFAFTANQITALKNLVGNGEISAFGSGSSSGGGGEGTSVEVIDDLTHHSNSDRYKALSAYQGYVLDKKIDSECDSLQQQIEAFPTVSSISNAVSNSHTHSNKTTLDKINETSYSHWNTAFTRAHTHSNKTTLDKIKETSYSNWNTAFANSHTHDNKTVLDGITATQVGYWNDTVDAVEQLNSYNLDYRVGELQEDLGALNNMYFDMDAVVSSHTTYLNSYNTRLNNIEAILAYMQLCEDSNGNAYIKFTCPVVSTGDIEAYK